jgi:hypothetical protein|nr:MAG TPA: Protein of unknown function (DUF1514) [Caudoviricetes sp.]
MTQDFGLSIFLLAVTLVMLCIQLYKNHKLEEEVELFKQSNKYLEDRIAKRDREGERDFKDLVAGIDGVSSVSLSSKRYVELLRAENDLIELKLKVKEVGNG